MKAAETSGAPAVTPISTVIIAKDSEERLEPCVRSCQRFSSEVLVVDGGSSDNTAKLAESLGCRVIVNPWPGYSAQRNLGAREATHDWIFSIDTDEVVDDRLAQALQTLAASGAGDVPAYSVRRINTFLGLWLTESPELKVRLYHRNRASFTERLVHELVDVPVEATKVLDGHIWHGHNFTLTAATDGLNKYTSLEAEIAAAERDMKPWRLFLRPILRFGQRYVRQRAFRHGWRGLVLAFHWAYWELLREMKVPERRRGEPPKPPGSA